MVASDELVKVLVAELTAAFRNAACWERGSMAAALAARPAPTATSTWRCCATIRSIQPWSARWSGIGLGDFEALCKELVSTS